MASTATSSGVITKPERAQQIPQNTRNGNTTQQNNHLHSVRSGNSNHHHHSNKSPASRRSVTPTSRSHSSHQDDNDAGRVRVAVRVRPRNTEELISDADFADSVELVPELRRLKLRKNNWSSESYRFDEVFTETASQKRVYQVVAKPVVESVLNGYNGTVMAYGQTGTGKTYTVGRLGKDDAAERGIMVRALEDIITSVNPAYDVLEVSYLQLYMESIQDLLAPERINIPINEDPRSGEVSLPGATVVRVRGLDHFSELLQIGETNRHAANTKQNTESSRSHAILTVYVRRSINQKTEDDVTSQENDIATDLLVGNGIPRVRKSKLLIVDLAGSERLNKSGSEGHLVEEAKFINLSLSSLGKCINALAENSPHIPTRESKLTRLLRDSFGGSARTSLIITIGPSARHHAETTSTVMFGQRAMKIVNVVKLKEEFDYESLCRKLETQVDHLTAEIEREQRMREKEKYDMEKQLEQCQEALVEAKKSHRTMSEFLEKEKTCLQQGMKDILNELDHQKGLNSLLRDKVAQLEMSLQHSQQQQHEIPTHQKVLADTTQMYEKKISELIKQLEGERAHRESFDEQLNLTKNHLGDHQSSMKEQQEVDELRVKIQEMYHLNESTLTELQSLKANCEDLLQEKATLSEGLYDLKKKFSVEEKQRKNVEYELAKLKETRDKKSCMKENIGHGSSIFSNSMKSNPRMPLSGQRAVIAKICEEAGLQKILKLLTSEDTDVQTHAVKLIANFAAEDINQEKIVEEGGLDALLILLRSSQNTTILRVASGAIANLAMNELNQELIMSKGGAQLLAETASRTDDPQTLRMVAGALANLCGNERLHLMLKEDGGIKSLLGMARSENSDVIAQIARGMANFAKCESRGIIQGHRSGRSLLLEDGALEWLIANANVVPTSTRRHVELALCHLAQNEDNVRDFISSGGVKELMRISVESNREDIRNLAMKMLKINPTFQAELHP